MIPLSFFWIALDVFCVIHAMRHGADRMWIYVIVLLPGIGAIAYLIAEVLPAMFGHRARKFAGSAMRTIDPERNLRRLEADLALVDSAENKRRVAEEQMRLGRYREAVELVESALVGIHKDDPSLLLALARASEGSADYARALEALDRLREAHPDFQSAEAHLIYARSLEGLGRDEEAMRELASLVTYATGEEARCRYAMLLRRHGREAEAQTVFKEILVRAKRANRRYRNTEREWIDAARREAVT